MGLLSKWSPDDDECQLDVIINHSLQMIWKCWMAGCQCFCLYCVGDPEMSGVIYILQLNKFAKLNGIVGDNISREGLFW